MPIVRHEMYKLSCEIKERLPPQMHVKNNISITGCNKDPSIKTPDATTFVIEYVFTTDYAEGKGSIEIKGKLYYIADSKTAEEITKSWEETKMLPEKVMLEVGNFGLMKSQMQAVLLANEMGLQSPVRMPLMEPKKKEE
ncbi:MAG: hypothetical protein ACMXYL_05790 [Candidatus Woesearchaeota archaeon]